LFQVLCLFFVVKHFQKPVLLTPLATGFQRLWAYARLDMGAHPYQALFKPRSMLKYVADTTKNTGF